MKKIIAISLAILLITGVAHATLKTYTTAKTPGYRLGPGPGQIVQMPYQTDPQKTFRMVRCIRPTAILGSADDPITLSKDMLVIWQTGVSGDGCTVPLTNTTNDTRVAGILRTDVFIDSDDLSLRATDDVGEENWGWLQTYGYSSVRFIGEATEGYAFGTAGD